MSQETKEFKVFTLMAIELVYEAAKQARDDSDQPNEELDTALSIVADDVLRNWKEKV